LTADRVLVEVVKHNLIYVSEEMGVALRKSAYSPNIRERADHSCAILDAKRRTVGQAEHIPVHVGSLSLGLRNTIQYLEEEGIEVDPGDMFIVNDPYIAGTHLNDITLIRPVFANGRVIAYTANKAHHVDVGGMSPASINSQAVELVQEGILLPPVKLMERDKLRSDVVHMLASNTRMPDVTLGDLRAQVAANLLGERRLADLASKVGVETFSDCCEALLDQTSKLAVTEYSKMPKGTWKGEDCLELDDKLLAIHARVTLSGEHVEVDFEGTDRQVRAPLNAVLGVTTAAATFAVKTLLRADLPLNDGFNRTIDIAAPTGSLVNPLRPAPVAGGNLETSQRIVDTVYKAMAEAMPDRIPAASHGSMNNLMIGGVHSQDRGSWAFYETVGGGYGGRLGLDGVDGVQVNMTNTLNTPIEVIEHYYPIEFEAYQLRNESGGPGEWRGGMGIERILTAKDAVQVVVLGERARVRPWGMRGGFPGQSSEYLVRRTDGTVTKLKSKDMLTLERNEALVVRTAGGGGYGDPKHRKPSSVKEDLDNEYITGEQARSIYGHAPSAY
jgi:N-methylhydantoinase B